MLDDGLLARVIQPDTQNLALGLGEADGVEQALQNPHLSALPAGAPTGAPAAPTQRYVRCVSIYSVGVSPGAAPPLPFSGGRPRATYERGGAKLNCGR